MKLGHVHIKVKELQRAVDFYTRYFDLEVTERVGGHFAFLTCSSMHHTLALQALGEGALKAPPKTVGLFHVAFEVPTKQQFAQSYRQLKKDGVEVFTIDHLISWAMYFDDPDGNGLEIYVDIRSESNGAISWEGNNRPLTEEQILKHS